jgi:hypothetical protein
MISMEVKDPENQYYDYDHFDHIREFITDFYYIENRRWFVNNIELQNKLLLIIRLGLHNKVFVASGDFDEHLDSILSQYYESKGEN